MTVTVSLTMTLNLSIYSINKDDHDDDDDDDDDGGGGGGGNVGGRGGDDDNDDNDDDDNDFVPLVTKVVGKSVLQNKILIVLISEKNERSLHLNAWFYFLPRFL